MNSGIHVLSSRKPAPRTASLHERTPLSVVGGFLAVWRRSMMDSVFFQTSLFSRALQGDGWLATVSDAPLPLHFIGGASVAHVSCIHFNWGGVAMHLICICIGARSLVDLPHPRFSGCRCGTEDLLLPHARASSRRGHDPDGSSGNGPYLVDPLIDIMPEPSRRPTRGRARSLRRRSQAVEGGIRRKLVLDEGGGGRHSSSWTRSRPPVVGRWWTPTGSRRHASVTRVGVDLTERACRPLIRLSTRRTAAARAVRVSGPRPPSSSLRSSTFFYLQSSFFNPAPTPGHSRARASLRMRSAAGGGGTGLRSGG
ncbi:hypothetical protein EVAR_37155_1 [Eumeta japonica]|uniref:Uncharacterized protein n=1 Tax=Eumeta variegata TaxID=151549 RepID=A0A4C1WHX6_EUMVA|nr:hypothetical protein EVAR_37155_1 [Eumeta japonica]